MFRLTGFIACVVCIFMVGKVYADDELNCENPRTQFEMNICAHESYKKADKELNEVYNKIVRTIIIKIVNSSKDDDGLTDNYNDILGRLRYAEKSWITFRDNWCAYEGSQIMGGSMAPMVINGCLEQLTREHIKRLEESLQL